MLPYGSPLNEVDPATDLRKANMVRAYHVLFSAYGFWLPNDPRGSWSEFVRSWELLRFGRATLADTRYSVAYLAHDRTARTAAKGALKYPPVQFNGVQARAIGNAFARFIQKNALTVYACSILPEHVHLVIARHAYRVEQIVNLLKGAATREMIADGMHPFAAFPTRTGRMPKMWARGHWKVYLNGEKGIERSVQYVEENPIKEGKPAQRWSFVRPLEG